MKPEFFDIEEKFYVCSCGGEAIGVWAYPFSDSILEIFLCFWSMGHIRHYPWRFRLRDIWHIIKYGHEFNDEICLSPKKARELAEHLIDLCDRWEAKQNEDSNR